MWLIGVVNIKRSICARGDPDRCRWFEASQASFLMYLTQWQFDRTYNFLRCLHLEIWRFSCWQRRRQTDVQTDCFTPCACARGNYSHRILAHKWPLLVSHPLKCHLLNHEGWWLLFTKTAYWTARALPFSIENNFATKKCMRVVLYYKSWPYSEISQYWDSIKLELATHKLN